MSLDDLRNLKIDTYTELENLMTILEWVSNELMYQYNMEIVDGNYDENPMISGITTTLSSDKTFQDWFNEIETKKIQEIAHNAQAMNKNKINITVAMCNVDEINQQIYCRIAYQLYD